MILRSLFFLFFSMLLLGACSENEPAAPPADILDEQAMEDILYRLKIAEALYQRTPKLQADKEQKRAAVQYHAVYEAFDISEDEFLTSFRWYSRNPRVLVAIYDRILNRLSEEQALLKEASVPEKTSDESNADAAHFE